MSTKTKFSDVPVGNKFKHDVFGLMQKVEPKIEKDYFPLEAIYQEGSKTSQYTYIWDKTEVTITKE